MVRLTTIWRSLALLSLGACATGTEPAATPELPAVIDTTLADASNIFLLGLISGLHGLRLAPYTPAAAHGTGSRAVAVGVLPDSVHGRTYVFDCSLNAYVRADSLTGAPANGLRVHLYALEDYGVPHCPLEHRATADIIDTLVNGVSGLHVVVDSTNPEVNYFDYTIVGLSIPVSGVAVEGRVWTGGRYVMLHGRSVVTGMAVVDRLILEWPTHGQLLAVRTLRTDTHLASWHTQFVTGGAVTDNVGEQLSNTSATTAVTVNGHALATLTWDGDSVQIAGPLDRELSDRERHTLSRLLFEPHSLVGVLRGFIYPVQEAFGFAYPL